MQSNTYSGLKQFLQFLEKDLGAHICIKDYIGFLPMNEDLDQTVTEYLAHSNDFCMYIKSDRRMYSRCLEMMRRLKGKLDTKDQCLCGTCYAGIKEYIVPVFWKKVLIGSVHAGIFPSSAKIVELRLSAICNSSASLSKNTALALYQKCVNWQDVPAERIKSSLCVIADCISLAFGSVVANGDFEGKRPDTVMMRNMIISDATEYIRRNFNQGCSTAQVAHFCHCSLSHLSHLFKSRLGVSVPVYVNRFRVEHAKELLRCTQLQIGHIANECGFNDPNYFSRVFARYAGITCSEYRRQANETPRGRTPGMENPL